MDLEIRTKRLMLRRARASDLDDLHRIASDYDIVKMTATWPWPPDRNFTAKRCLPMDPEEGLGGPVFRGSEMVGAMGISGGDMGYMIARHHWGQGYATEIGQAMIAQAFATYDWPEITACVFADNPGSVRVLENLGFDETGLCSGPCAARGRDLPMRTFRLPRPRTA